MAESKLIHWFNRMYVLFIACLKHVITPINLWLLKATNGRLGSSFLGKSVLLLTTIGAKSGLERVTPLFYMQHDGKIILVASNGGNTKNPAWILNITANPEIKVNIKGHEAEMRARITSAEERQRYWSMATELFSKWGDIQGRSLREFPIVVLESRQAD